MLLELLVENYAVVERAQVRFHGGLNLLTGETGSGKSIVVDALGLLLGARASAEVVRAEADRARVSGIFEVPSGSGFREMVERSGIEVEDGELLVAREVLANGKSRAFVGGRPVTAALLRELAPFLGDIHGQHEQQELFSSEAQLHLLDDFAGSGARVERTARIFREWRQCTRELEELEGSEQEKLRLTDLWRFQKKEIEAAALQPGEDGQLENEKRVLRNAGKLQESAGAAYAALYESGGSVASQLRVAVKKLEELSRIDTSLERLCESLKPAEAAVDDASRELADYLERLEADPGRLDQIESRMAEMDKLKRKYGGTLDEIAAFLATVSEQLSGIENAGERKTALDKQLAQLAGDYGAAAAELTETRKAAARKLAKKVEQELGSLAMAGSVFRIELEAAPWSERGADRVQFVLAANRGEEARPLERVASGGELSRIALALKTCTGAGATAAGVPRMLVFDEVDTGIGGSVADAVGRRLKKIAASSQVLCVTHLAQIASFADHHYFVSKRDVKGRTVAEVEELSSEARMREVGRMLSGQDVTPEALKHAAQLIRMGTQHVQ